MKLSFPIFTTISPSRVFPRASCSSYYYFRESGSDVVHRKKSSALLAQVEKRFFFLFFLLRTSIKWEERGSEISFWGERKNGGKLSQKKEEEGE